MEEVKERLSGGRSQVGDEGKEGKGLVRKVKLGVWKRKGRGRQNEKK